jgi:hypothetical protein
MSYKYCGEEVRSISFSPSFFFYRLVIQSSYDSKGSFTKMDKWPSLPMAWADGCRCLDFGLRQGANGRPLPGAGGQRDGAECLAR